MNKSSAAADLELKHGVDPIAIRVRIEPSAHITIEVGNIGKVDIVDVEIRNIMERRLHSTARRWRQNAVKDLLDHLAHLVAQYVVSVRR